MYTQGQFTPSTGEAYIAVRKNRVKSYPSPLSGVRDSIYLSDKQEFEIELFNPSTTTKLAKISIDGKPISSSGIVLKPGQRSYIERYIDTPRKFQFDTYTVENSSAAIAAIQNNGLVEISFYDEYIPLQYNITTTPTINWDLTWGSTGAQNINYLNQQTENLLSRITPVSTYCSTAGGASCDTSAKMSMFSEKLRSSEAVTGLKKTGKVEQGGLSQQKFTNYSGSFNVWVTNTVTIKLLPFSEKPLEINEIASYCTECGTKNKGNKFKFCPTCGNRF